MELNFNIRGTSPLLMHSDKLVNPLHPLAIELKKLTSTRKKTEAILKEISSLEWSAAIYHDESVGPYIPGANLYAAVIAGAKFNKLGAACKRGMLVSEDKCPLIYKGSRDKQSLYEEGSFVDYRSVKIQTAKIMRCRPIFRSWETSFTIVFNEEILNKEQLRQAVVDAGNLVGVCDYRPLFGRFEIV